MKISLTLFMILLAGITLRAQQTVKIDENLLLDYYQTQRFADAHAYLKQAYPEPVTDLKALSRLAYTAQMAGKLPDAEAYYMRVYNRDSSIQGVLYNLASINFRRGNLTKAQDYYLMMVKKDSTNFSTYKQLAQISYAKNNIPNYITYLQRANKLNPQDPDVASDLSDMYVTLKQLNQAAKMLNQAIDADPENVVLLESMVKLCYAQHKWNETIATGEKLISLGNSALPVLSKLGQCYYATKSYQCGIDILKSIEQQSQNETTYYFTALCYKALKDQKNAIVFFNKSVVASISPNVGAYYGEMADSYVLSKNIKKALGAYQKSIEFDNKPLAYYNIANLYDVELKNKSNALLYYKKYLNAGPPHEQQAFVAYSKARIAELSH